MRQPNMAYRGVPARGYPIGPDNRRRPGRTGFSPFSRSTRFPFTSTASPPAPLAIRKAPSASVESIQPRPPQPCEVGRSKGRRRKSRRQSHKFFKHLLRLVLTRARCVSSSLLLSCKASLGTKSLPVLGGKCLGRSLRTIGAKKLAFFVEHLFPSSTQQCLNV